MDAAKLTELLQTGSIDDVISWLEAYCRASRKSAAEHGGRLQEQIEAAFSGAETREFMSFEYDAPEQSFAGTPAESKQIYFGRAYEYYDSAKEFLDRARAEPPAETFVGIDFTSVHAYIVSVNHACGYRRVRVVAYSPEDVESILTAVYANNLAYLQQTFGGAALTVDCCSPIHGKRYAEREAQTEAQSANGTEPSVMLTESEIQDILSQVEAAALSGEESAKLSQFDHAISYEYFTSFRRIADLFPQMPLYSEFYRAWPDEAPVGGKTDGAGKCEILCYSQTNLTFRFFQFSDEDPAAREFTVFYYAWWLICQQSIWTAAFRANEKPLETIPTGPYHKLLAQVRELLLTQS